MPRPALTFSPPVLLLRPWPSAMHLGSSVHIFRIYDQGVDVGSLISYAALFGARINEDVERALGNVDADAASHAGRVVCRELLLSHACRKMRACYAPATVRGEENCRKQRHLHQRPRKDQCGLGLLLSRSRELTASSRLTTNIHAVRAISGQGNLAIDIRPSQAYICARPAGRTTHSRRRVCLPRAGHC